MEFMSAVDEGDHVYCKEGPIPVLVQVYYLNFPHPLFCCCFFVKQICREKRDLQLGSVLVAEMYLVWYWGSCIKKRWHVVLDPLC